MRNVAKHPGRAAVLAANVRLSTQQTSSSSANRVFVRARRQRLNTKRFPTGTDCWPPRRRIDPNTARASTIRPFRRLPSHHSTAVRS